MIIGAISLRRRSGLLRRRQPCAQRCRAGFRGALRQRLSLNATAGCARLGRLREDEAAPRDAKHLAPIGAAPSPASRLHHLFASATRPLRPDAAALAAAAEPTLAGVAAALQEILARAGSPLAAAAGASRAVMVVLAEAGPRAPVGSSNFCSATRRSRRRPRPRRQGCQIAPSVVCLTGWSSSAPHAKSRAARIFSSMDYSVFARSGNRFARGKRVKKGM